MIKNSGFWQKAELGSEGRVIFYKVAKEGRIPKVKRASGIKELNKRVIGKRRGLYE